MNVQLMRSIAELALAENRLLEIKYKDSEGEITTRQVETLEVDTVHDNITAWCRTRNQFRTFKLNNFQTVKITDVHYRPVNQPVG